MGRVKLDTADRAVKEFARSLRLGQQGLEVELDGRVLFKVIPPTQLSEAEIASLLNRGRELVRRARQRNQDVPTRAIEREVRQAVRQVRRKR